MKKTLFLSHICLIFTGIFLSFSINAEMYKWVDEDGNTHYSQSRPVENMTVETIKPQSGVDTESALKTLDKRKKTADKLREERIKKAEDVEKAKQDLAMKKEQCEKAKKIQASYERPRVNYVDEDGNRRRGTEEERQQDLAKAKERVNKRCNY